METDDRKQERKRNYYNTTRLGPEDLADLERAREVEGVDDEIELLRSLLKKAVEAPPEQAADALRSLKVATRGVETLIRAVATRHRVSPPVRKDLADNLAATLNSLGDLLLPPD